MTLDATVYCDCIERGVANRHPQGLPLLLDTDGSLCTPPGLSDDEAIAFDQWARRGVCEHTNGILATFYLGNIATISVIRSILARNPAPFPVLLNKVVHNGVHCADWLSPADTLALGPELLAIEDLLRDDGQVLEPNDRGLLGNFLDQMRALRELSTRVGKPIVF